MWLICIFSLLLFTLSQIISSAVATSQFTYSNETDPPDGFCWKLSNYSTNWTEAINTCHSSGRYMASVWHNHTFNAFSAFAGTKRVWTNLMAKQNNQSISGYNMWISNDVTWNVTSIYVPNNDSTYFNETPNTQTCIYFDFDINSVAARYVDTQCNNSFPFICSMFPSMQYQIEKN